jgi:hypothetical protein
VALSFAINSLGKTRIRQWLMRARRKTKKARQRQNAGGPLRDSIANATD